MKISFFDSEEHAKYINKFTEAVDQLDKPLFVREGIDVAVGIYEGSVFLKLYKKYGRMIRPMH